MHSNLQRTGDPNGNFPLDQRVNIIHRGCHNILRNAKPFVGRCVSLSKERKKSACIRYITVRDHCNRFFK